MVIIKDVYAFHSFRYSSNGKQISFLSSQKSLNVFLCVHNMYNPLRFGDEIRKYLSQSLVEQSPTSVPRFTHTYVYVICSPRGHCHDQVTFIGCN